MTSNSFTQFGIRPNNKPRPVINCSSHKPRRIHSAEHKHPSLFLSVYYYHQSTYGHSILWLCKPGWRAEWPNRSHSASPSQTHTPGSKNKQTHTHTHTHPHTKFSVFHVRSVFYAFYTCTHTGRFSLKITLKSKIKPPCDDGCVYNLPLLAKL